MHKKRFLLVVFLILVIVGISIENTYHFFTPKPLDKMRVSASFYPLAFLAHQIGGESVSVFTVTPAGSEPHDYEPSARDVATILDSRVLLLNGVKLEAWSSDIKKNIDPSSTLLVTASDGLSVNGNDPHLWLDPVLLKQVGQKVTDAFVAANPNQGKIYLARQAILNAALDQLDQEYRDGLRFCAKKDIITSHSAFGYLAKEYGLREVSIAGLSPDAEPSPKQLAGIASFAEKNNVKYIFFESLVSPRLADTLAAEIGARTLVLNPIEGLTPSELAAGKNYFTEMRANLVNLKIALQCQ